MVQRVNDAYLLLKGNSLERWSSELRSGHVLHTIPSKCSWACDAFPVQRLLKQYIL